MSGSERERERATKAEAPMSSSTVFVGDLSVFCSEPDLARLFSPFGALQDVRIIRENKSNQPLFYGFVEFEQSAAAEQALSLHGTLYMGRCLRVSWATTPVTSRFSSRSSSSKSRLSERFGALRIDANASRDTLAAAQSTDEEEVTERDKPLSVDNNDNHEAISPLQTPRDAVGAANESERSVSKEAPPQETDRGERATSTQFRGERRSNHLTPSVQILFSFITNQAEVIVTEEFIREVFSVFGQLMDVCIKKIKINKLSRTQNGYGFVHYTSDLSGVQAALHAVSCFHKRVVQHVKFDCKVSHQFQQFLSDERNAKMLGFPGAVSLHVPVPMPHVMPSYSPREEGGVASANSSVWQSDAGSVSSSRSHTSSVPSQQTQRRATQQTSGYATSAMSAGAYPMHAYPVMMLPHVMQSHGGGNAHMNPMAFHSHVSLMATPSAAPMHPGQPSAHHPAMLGAFPAQYHAGTAPMFVPTGAAPPVFVSSASLHPSSAGVPSPPSQAQYYAHAHTHAQHAAMPGPQTGVGCYPPVTYPATSPQQQQHAAFSYAAHQEGQHHPLGHAQTQLQSHSHSHTQHHHHQHQQSSAPTDAHLAHHSMQYYRYGH